MTKPFDRKEFVSVLEKAVAERSTLWRTQMVSAPLQSVVIEAKRMDKTASVNTIGLGRGGFSVYSRETLVSGQIAFRLLLADSTTEITGQGCVLWRLQADGKAGIELAFLDPDCRASLTEAIDAASTRSFIYRAPEMLCCKVLQTQISIRKGS